VVVYVEAGRDSYSGSTDNGVTSSDWGSFGSTIVVTAPMVDTSAAVAEAPAVAAPVVEAPVVESPVVEAPVVEAPVVEAPAPTQPVVAETKPAGSDECGTIPPGVENYSCSCASGVPDRSVWGSGPYTADSDLCTAARHAGVIGAQGGNVSVSLIDGQDSYSGSTQNGVETRDWGAYGNSIMFAGAVAAANSSKDAAVSTPVAECGSLPSGDAPYVCACPVAVSNLPVWGSGPYTADSDICTAARHSGAVGAQGGVIVVEKSQGLDAYHGSSQNGVNSNNWGNYHTSIFIRSNAMNFAATSTLPACSVIPGGAADHRCSCQGNEAGTVWGSGPYTADSDLCTAALHDGVIGGQGGEVHAIRVPGLTSYRSSESNGVSTGQWGNYNSSVIFNWN